MADKTYRMTVTLSDGSSIDAGTFVAPQGPNGIFGTWQTLDTNTFVFEQNSIYLLEIVGAVGICSTGSFPASVTFSAVSSWAGGEGSIKTLKINSSGKIEENADVIKLSPSSGISYTTESTRWDPIRYIKLA